MPCRAAMQMHAIFALTVEGWRRPETMTSASKQIAGLLPSSLNGTTPERLWCGLIERRTCMAESIR